MPSTRIRDLTLEDFLAAYPRIAGADEAADAEPAAKSLADVVAELEADVKRQTTKPAEKSAETDQAAELDRRKAELDAFEKSLTTTATALEATSKRLTEHAGSRFVDDGATDEVAEAVAAGGSHKEHGMVIAGNGIEAVQAGASRGAKALTESKSLIRFLAAMNAVQKGLATDAEREFLSAQSQKALAEGTGSAGGYLIPPNWMPDILPLIRGIVAVRRANPRIIPFGTQLNQIQLSAGATAYYTPENAAITPSQETFGQVTLLTPKNLTGLVPVGNYLLNDLNRTDFQHAIDVNAEQLVRDDLAMALAVKEDRAFLMGAPGTETGSPTGIINMPGIVSSPLAPGANGFSPTLPQLRAIRNYTRQFSLPTARWTWFFNPQFLSYVEQLTDTLGHFLADSTLLRYTDDVGGGSAANGVGQQAGFSGVLDGVPFYCSNAIPTNLTTGTSTNTSYLLLVDVSNLVVGYSQALTIDSSAEASYTPDAGTTWISAYQNNQTLFRGVMRHDLNHLRPYTVIKQNGIIIP